MVQKRNFCIETKLPPPTPLNTEYSSLFALKPLINKSTEAVMADTPLCVTMLALDCAGLLIDVNTGKDHVPDTLVFHHHGKDLDTSAQFHVAHC